MKFIRWLDTLTNRDISIAGGKNASLGEMIRELSEQGIRVPDGFVITAHAYRALLAHNGIEGSIREQLRLRAANLSEPGEAERAIRDLLMKSEFPPGVEEEITAAYLQLGERYGEISADVAVRSSATAEDLPDASFAGQHDSFLGISGIHDVLHACRKCFASLFTDRAVSYRDQKGFDHLAIALSIGVQRMVRADVRDGASGVMFGIDTETGFPDVIVINASFGLGESIVQGAVTPDEYRVFKPLVDTAGKIPIIEKVLGMKEIKTVYRGQAGSQVHTVKTPFEQRQRFALVDDQILRLASWSKRLEEHYRRPMDVEWAFDGESGELFILQARPETVQSRLGKQLFRSYKLLPSEDPPRAIVKGLAIGSTIARGKARLLTSASEAGAFDAGDVLVAPATNPDWVPVMRKAAAIVTDHGGRSSHAAIVSRELGVPAVIGTGEATRRIANGDDVTVSCAEGETGTVYNGLLDFEGEEINLADLPRPRVPIMLNIATPEAAFRWWRLPCQGIGLARMEFIINQLIRVHPMALVRFDQIEDERERKEILRLTRAYVDMPSYFVDQLASGIAHIAASRYPQPVVVRTSDFKTNEYAALLGGRQFEPKEENPMIGFRGASRYYHEAYRDGFALECKAIKKAREVIGLDNVIVMIPFCRTLEEADKVLAVMAENGLRRGENGLKVQMMAEIPSNIILAAQFSERFDGFSVGSNDLTQLILGVDRDSEMLAHLFDERNEAVEAAIKDLVVTAHSLNCTVGICGQGASDHPDFTQFLVGIGIDYISINPDSLVTITRQIATD